MKRVLCVVLSLIMFLSLAGCGSGSSSSEAGTQGDTSLISVPSVTGLTLDEAKKTLSDAGITNVSSNYENSDFAPERIIVVEQSKKAYSKISQSETLVLTCKILYEAYLDLESEANLLLNRYDMDIELDGTKIGVVSNGAHFTKLVSVLEGEHKLVFHKSGSSSPSVSCKFTVSGPLTFKAVIAHGGSIELKESSIVGGIVGSSLEVPSVEGMVLSQATAKLKEIGFVNVRYEPNGDIWNTDNWLVTAQSVPAGTTLDKNERIALDCVKIEAYVTEAFTGKTVSEAIALASSGGFNIEKYRLDDYTDVSARINEATSEQKDYWVVKSASQNSSNNITLVVEYLGTPEERAAAEAAELLRNDLEHYLPIETAKKAIVVAFTNYNAEDVFTADGDNYDPSKFHGYNYNGDFKQQITDEGTWTPKSETAWHVENLFMKLKSFSLRTKLCCDVSFDGSNYTISNVRLITGGSVSDINAEDPAKTSGWQAMEPGDFYNMLIVPSDLVTGSGGNNKSETVVNSENYGSNTEYDKWVGEQFSSWDGHHKAFQDLIKKNLNDEKSYKHIETKYRLCTTQATVDEINTLLKNSGYSERVEMNDILISTEFSAKNAFNATIKATAIGIARYRTNQIILVDMG